MKKTLLFSVLALVISMPSLAVSVQKNSIAQLIEVGKFHSKTKSNSGDYYVPATLYTAWCIGNNTYLAFDTNNTRTSNKAIDWSDVTPSVKNIQPLGFHNGTEYHPVKCANFKEYRDRHLIPKE